MEENKIVVFFRQGAEERARQIAYGIEEEGLPHLIRQSESPFEDALNNTVQQGLGVAVGVDEQTAQIFCRQYKKREAFMHDAGADNGALRVVGKNSARILKHKPFQNMKI